MLILPWDLSTSLVLNPLKFEVRWRNVYLNKHANKLANDHYFQPFAKDVYLDDKAFILIVSKMSV